MAQDRWASLVLITALQRVDDTSLLRSVIISELLVGHSHCHQYNHAPGASTGLASSKRDQAALLDT